ncbi:TPA: alpha-hydroxy-acid oxidizing protein [Enterococcus faecium]|nr:lactate oxidase [Enterococcus faecium]HAP9188401.1 lactate oxidase [Enterococcus faecium]HAV0136404.1 lactate oxidase [Enterococcus faecium]HAV0138525.1 lactate oxidase [Enterococcus faecium]HCD2025311.1 alpha-hydroxy-acid oxidizing protein [Enterococcus faecium]
MEAGAFGYIRGGSEDEWTMKENTTSFNTKKIMPRILRGIDSADLHTSVFGIELDTPIIQAPSAAQGLAHEKGEADTAKGVAAAGSIFSISTYANTTIKDAADAAKGVAAAGSIFSISTYANTTIKDAADAAPGAPQFFQLYMSKDDRFNEFILNKAVEAGAKAIILTADSTLGGYREEDVINQFQFPLPMPNLAAYSEQSASGNGEGKGIAEIYAAAKQGLTPDDIKTIKEITHLPVIVKGIQSPEDAVIAISAGADGIWVSNHGGRQLDGGPASFEVLPKIAEVVNKRVPVIFDSGVRRGEHVFKALASGADLVAIGRPVIYGLNLGGAEGVTSVFEHLNKELSITMQLAGTKTIDEVKNTKLMD